MAEAKTAEPHGWAKKSFADVVAGTLQDQPLVVSICAGREPVTTCAAASQITLKPPSIPSKRFERLTGVRPETEQYSSIRIMGKVEEKFDTCSHSELKKCSSGGNPPEDSEDHISSLPDGILLLILSSLKCEEMAQTSLLSRRWMNLWMHTQSLHFDHPIDKCRVPAPSRKESRNFVDRVNHVLKLHKSQKLNEFRINCCWLGKRYKTHISSWLGYALKRKVEHLELNLEGPFTIDSEKDYDFSDRFLKLNSEKGVQVANPDRRGNCFVTCLDFRSLKSLSLKSVKVNSEAIDFVLQNCPLLERLEVVGSQELDKLVISDPKLALKYLHIDVCGNCEFVSISNINLVTLIICTKDLRLTNLPMLVELWIEGFEDAFRRAFSQSSCCLSQLRSLRITTYLPEYIAHVSQLVRFTKLKRLVIKTGAWVDERLIDLVSFLEDCPCLEEFVLKVTRTVMTLGEKKFVKVEGCSPLKCLKVFKFVGYHGSVTDLELAREIVEKSVVLEKIVIDPHSPYRTEEVKEETRNIALQQFEDLKESVQPRLIIL